LTTRIASPARAQHERGRTVLAKKTKSKRSRDVEKGYPTNQFVAKLRRLADALETGEDFRIQIAGERVRVPAGAIFNIEHERGDGAEEIEFQIKWKL
jgi:amphi-Trp domain-containing protein